MTVEVIYENSRHRLEVESHGDSRTIDLFVIVAQGSYEFNLSGRTAKGLAEEVYLTLAYTGSGDLSIMREEHSLYGTTKVVIQALQQNNKQGYVYTIQIGPISMILPREAMIDLGKTLIEASKEVELYTLDWSDINDSK